MIPSQKEIRAAAIEYAEDMCKMFEPGTENEKYCKNDFIAGAQWVISQLNIKANVENYENHTRNQRP